MPHLAMVALSGFRVREPEMLELGMQLPGLHDRAMAIAALPALGLLTLAGMTPQRWAVSYHDPAVIDEDLVERIVGQQPKLVAISALTASILDAYRLCDALRARGIAAVLGGLHVTACPEEALRHATAIVVGDGEPVWHRVLEDAQAGRLGGRYQADRPFDLRAAPMPRFELLGSRSRPRFTLQTARGCPLACDFCGASRLLGPFREKPADLIREELRAITTLQPRAVVELADDNSFAGRRDMRELLAALAESRVRYFTEADWRIGEREDVLRDLAASGCMQVLVGMESMVHVHGGMGRKRAAFVRMLDAVNAIQAHGVSVIACFIVGSDGEDHESLQALGEFLIDAPFADVQLTIVTPFPGTALRERLAREGRLLPDRGWESCTLFDVAHQPDRLSAQELEQGFRKLVQYAFCESAARRRADIRRGILAGRKDSRS